MRIHGALLVLIALSASGADAVEAPSPRWYRGNTHTHTLNSDGDSAPVDVARWYREHGYQFVFITDHEHVTEVDSLNELLSAPEQFLVLPGQEVTQWSDDPTRANARVNVSIGASAHINSLFATRVVWPVGKRICLTEGGMCSSSSDIPIGETLERNVAAVRASGGVAQVNHPNLLWALKPEDLANVPDGTLLEIWNGAGYIINNLGGDDGHGDVRPSAEGFWDYALSRGRIVWGVGADDAHVFRPDKRVDSEGSIGGQAWIMVRSAGLTAAALRAAIENGEFYASTGVELADVTTDGERLALTIEPKRTVFHNFSLRYSTKFVGQGGRVLATVAGMSPAYRFAGSETYVRAVVTDSNGKQAWTQPVFRDGRGPRSPYVLRLTSERAGKSSPRAAGRN